MGSPCVPKFRTIDDAFTTVCESQELPKADPEVQRGIVFAIPAELVVTVPWLLAGVEVMYLLPPRSKIFWDCR